MYALVWRQPTLPQNSTENFVKENEKYYLPKNEVCIVRFSEKRIIFSTFTCCQFVAQNLEQWIDFFQDMISLMWRNLR